jgi:hypothetical protein
MRELSHGRGGVLLELQALLEEGEGVTVEVDQVHREVGQGIKRVLEVQGCTVAATSLADTGGEDGDGGHELLAEA